MRPGSITRVFVLSCIFLTPCLVEAEVLSLQVGNVCRGDDICVSISGGTPPYGVSWNDGTTSLCIPSPTPGTYWATVVDADGISATAGGVVLDEQICPELCIEFTAVTNPAFGISVDVEGW